MRDTRKFGRPLDRPRCEPLRYRALDLGRELRLCDWCLQGNRRCYDSIKWARRQRKHRSWKLIRLTRWKRVGPCSEVC